MLRRNRGRFLSSRQASEAPSPEPINGWECWGLGYLDEDEKKVGCLLHPAQHSGTDYRYLVGYHGKCAREVCLEAQTFEALTEKARRFYLDMTLGMDSFEYSSREENPIFPVLLWGRVISEKIAEIERFDEIHRDEFKERYYLLFTVLSYKIDGYFLEKVVETMGAAFLRDPGFYGHYRKWQEKLLEQYRINDTSCQATPGRNPSIRPVHLYDVPLSFSRFLKFVLNLWNAPEERITSLKEQIDKEIERFIESSHPLFV